MDSNLQSTKHTRGVITSNFPQPINLHLSKMESSHYPKRVLWNCDVVIDIYRAWVLLVKKNKQVYSCSLTTTACNSDNAINEFDTLFT